MLGETTKLLRGIPFTIYIIVVSMEVVVMLLYMKISVL